MKIYLNIFSPNKIRWWKYIQIYFLPTKYGGENIFKYIFSPEKTVVKIYLNIFSPPKIRWWKKIFKYFLFHTWSIVISSLLCYLTHQYSHRPKTARFWRNLASKSIVRKIFDVEMLIKSLPITILEIFFKIILNSKVITKKFNILPIISKGNRKHWWV